MDPAARARATCPLLWLALLAWSPSAPAATVSLDPRCYKDSCSALFEYRAEAGERNDVRVGVSYVPGPSGYVTSGSVTVRDPGAVLRVVSEFCHLIDAHTAVCSNPEPVQLVDVHAGDLDDRVHGPSGAFPPLRAYGEAGEDLLVGGAGDDRLAGGLGDDVIEGGPGSDTAAYTRRERPVRADLQRQVARIGSRERDRLAQIERLVGGSRNDVLLGDARRNVLAGGPGDDELRGRSGVDSLAGGPGDDVLDGGRGTDILGQLDAGFGDFGQEDDPRGRDRHRCGLGRDRTSPGPRTIVETGCETIQLDGLERRLLPDLGDGRLVIRETVPSGAHTLSVWVVLARTGATLATYRQRVGAGDNAHVVTLPHAARAALRREPRPTDIPIRIEVRFGPGNAHSESLTLRLPQASRDDR